MTKKESQNGSTMGISHYTINEKVSKTRVEESSAIVQKYNNLPLCKDLVLAVIGELERKEKAMRGKRT